MIGLLLINLYSACNPRLCAAECERHILGNRQETAEGRGGWSRGRRWNQVRGGARKNSEFWNRVISSDFQAWAWGRWECSQELLLQQITLV